MKLLFIQLLSLATTSVFAGTPGDGFSVIECSSFNSQKKVIEMTILDSSPLDVYSYSKTFVSELTGEEIQTPVIVLYKNEKLSDGRVRFQLAKVYSQVISVVVDPLTNSAEVENYDSDDGELYTTKLSCVSSRR